MHARSAGGGADPARRLPSVGLMRPMAVTARGVIPALTVCAALAGCGAQQSATPGTDRAGQRADRRLAELERNVARLKSERRPRSPRPKREERQLVPRWAVEKHRGPPKPRIHRMFIPFPTTRKHEMADYAQRHYGTSAYRLRDPKVLVEHYTGTPDVQSTYNTFARDVADPELRELPGTCSHFVIARNGTIYQLVPLTIMCRHTVGLNYTSIGVEHVGISDEQVLSNRSQLRSSLALTRWLRCQYDISVMNVIGHNESLSSPYHYERVTRLRSQTHDDWVKRNMDTYRTRLRAKPC
jgi:N-acetylmuramoyl-L-alanine amidase